MCRKFLSSAIGRGMMFAAVLALGFSFAAPLFAQEDLQKSAKISYGKIEGKIDIGGKLSKAKYPVPSSSVRAYRLYSPGFCAAAIIPPNGKYKLKVPPGPYAVLFDVWSENGQPVSQAAQFIWIKQGETYSIEGDAPKTISIGRTLLSDTNGIPFSPAEGLFYDYTPFMTAYMIIKTKSIRKSIQFMEDWSSGSSDEILALIEANSNPAIPESERLDRNLALAHVQSALSYRYNVTARTDSITPKTALPLRKISFSSLSIAMSILGQTSNPVMTEDMTIDDPKGAFDRAVSARLLKLLKKLRKQMEDEPVVEYLPLPDKISLNFQGERVYDAFELIPDIGIGNETWESGPIVFRRNPSIESAISTSEIQVAAYTIDKASTMLSSTEWKMVGAHLNGEFFEPTNLDSPTVIQILIQKVTEGATTQSYWIGGEVWENHDAVVVYTNPQTQQTLEVNPYISVQGQGQMTPYTGSNSISVNTSYEAQEPISKQPTKWTYQLINLSN